MHEVERRIKKQHGYDGSQARKHFPELCCEISAKRRKYNRTMKEVRLKNLCDEVQQATRSIYANGEYPSIHYLERYLKKPGCMLNPEVVTAWRETMREIGLRDK
jgi:hypothetical protein